MAQEWFYTKDNKSNGPVSSAALQALVKSGQLLSTDMVCKAGADHWTPASTIKGLFPNAQSTATTSSPPGVAAVNSPVAYDDDDGPITKNHESSSKGGKSFSDFLLFKWMISPWLLVILFWLGVLGFIGKLIGLQLCDVIPSPALVIFRIINDRGRK